MRERSGREPEAEGVRNYGKAVREGGSEYQVTASSVCNAGLTGRAVFDIYGLR